MRTITDHKLQGMNDPLEITVLDEPGQGGACHKYLIAEPPPPARPRQEGFHPVSRVRCEINFQNGLTKEAGVNGISNEALLAIVIDRIRSFQAGPFASEYNAVALSYIKTGLFWLGKRTKERILRGVEGANQK